MRTTGFIRVVFTSTIVYCCFQAHDVFGEMRVVTSPNYPNPYTSNDDGWLKRLAVSEGKRLKITVTDISFKPTDNLYIYDGYYCSDAFVGQELLKKLGHNDAKNTPVSVFATENWACLELDVNTGGDRGFLLVVSEIPAENGVYIANEDDIISPYYPVDNYRYSTHCRWEIKLAPGQGIEYTIREFDVATSPNCALNYLKITPLKNYDIDHRFCGRSIKGTELFSQHHENVVIFKTEKRAMSSWKNTGHKGFWIRYKAIGCKISDLPRNVGELTNHVDFTDFGHVATFSCKSGYWYITRQRYLNYTCMTDGIWAGNKIECKEIRCLQPANPLDGIVRTTNGIGIGSKAVYACNSNFYLIGVTRRECLTTGEWSDAAPTCKANITNCDVLVPPRNGRVRAGGTNVGSMTVFECNEGYKLVGEEYLICQRGGHWDKEPPKCEVIRCGADLKAPANGLLQLYNDTYGSTATYSCEEGYDVAGSETRRCQDNNRWSGDQPQCKAIACEDPEPPKNGMVDKVGRYAGGNATFACQPGYKLQGSDTIICEYSGKWIGEAPTCDGMVLTQAFW